MSDAYSSPPKPLEVNVSPGAGVRRPITVRVGYGWRGKVRNDVRWTALRKFLTAVGEQARGRAVRKLNKNAAAALRVPRIRRLRATVGEQSWASIKTAISNCDILVFDITPTKAGLAGRTNRRAGQKVTSPNVWLEIGYALGRKKRVFLVHSKVGGYKDLPSDLHGHVIGHVPDDGGQVDISLRNKLVNVMARLLAEENIRLA
jgi:hypothetical protein